MNPRSINHTTHEILKMMSKRRTTSIIIISLLCSFLISCKKKDIPLISPTTSVTPVTLVNNKLPFTEKIYYFEYQKTENGPFIPRTTNFDLVQRCYVENDSLKILNWGFPITAENQTYFEFYRNESTILHIQVWFSANYGTVNVEVFNDDIYYTTTRTYHGILTSLLISQQPHAYANDLQGAYFLDVLYNDSCLGVDTTFSDTLQISLYRDSTIIGDYRLDGLEAFHSYSNSDFFTTPFFNHQSIYWKNDSLRFYKYALPSFSTNGCLDTIHYLFQGRKL